MANNLSTGDSIAAAAVLVSLFALLTLTSLIRLIQHRIWLCISFIVGVESTHELGNTNPTSVALKIVQVLCILLTPVLFAAAIYMTLGRIIRATDGENHSLLHSIWITKISVSGDALCFITQMTGAGVIAAGGSAKLSGDIVLGG